MKVKQQKHLSKYARDEFDRAMPYANFDWAEIERIMSGEDEDVEHWVIWNVGNLCYVFTIINWLGEIEVLMCAGEKVRDCLPYWEKAISEDPKHKGRTLMADGRKGWRRILSHWDFWDGVLYRKV
jgi:hypothetical protein